MKLIDADALHKAYMELRNFKQDPQSGDWISLRAVPLTTVIRMLNEAPTIEPKREEWADIIGYEGLYQISNEARVRNQKGEIMKQYIKRGRSTCYKAVKLYKNGRYETRYIHRIMAECFIPNPNNLPMINHIDEDGTNNRLDNLEWCTVKYNSNYGNARRNMSKGKKKKSNCGADMREREGE